MAQETHLDGNAIGGLLTEFFGRELTDALGRCARCGAVNAVGAFIVYRSGPGDVVRCPGCSAVLMVASHIANGLRLFFPELRWLEVD